MIGCILIPGYLNPSEQADLLTSALSTYTLPPNPLSLSTHYDLPPDLFRTYITEPEYKVQTSFSKLSPDQQEAIRTREQEIGHRVTKESKPGSEVGYEKILQSGKVWEGDVPGSQLSERSVGELMKELRWANLGWVYRVSLVRSTLKSVKKKKADQIVDDKIIRFRYPNSHSFSNRFGEYMYESS
jgi:alkylated DNA repair protein alkB family protein 1